MRAQGLDEFELVDRVASGLPQKPVDDRRRFAGGQPRFVDGLLVVGDLLAQGVPFLLQRARQVEFAIELGGEEVGAAVVDRQRLAADPLPGRRQTCLEVVDLAAGVVVLLVRSVEGVASVDEIGKLLQAGACLRFAGVGGEPDRGHRRRPAGRPVGDRRIAVGGGRPGMLQQRDGVRQAAALQLPLRALLGVPAVDRPRSRQAFRQAFACLLGGCFRSTTEFAEPVADVLRHSAQPLGLEPLRLAGVELLLPRFPPRQPGCRFADLQWRQAVRRQQRRPVPREFLRVAGERGGALAVEIEGSLHL
ncbi:MAG: hypothetical protein AW08_03358 [Candidatus Accumulibacter adjunctus]|uniref:Uncharacterized protein n=1 Tax=Candidatus Accumulibacter adjunctus TaxID=1454001 RepID=A0A011NL85_9PROT|nr:MAG: hypothetical protein AW08_03358 [Candidatus Accumulibacter adjunctus]